MNTPNPCVRQCCLDHHEICLGCGRSLREILDWHHASDADKAAILARAQQRLQQANTPLKPQPPSAQEP